MPDVSRLPHRLVVALGLLLALVLLAGTPASAAGTVSGDFAIEGKAYPVTDVSAERLAGGDGEPTWRLVFSERPHEHSAAGRESAIDGAHGLAFVVEVLEDGEGHNFVLYLAAPGSTSTYPSSFPWPQVSDLAAADGKVAGRVRHNADFPFGGMTFDLRFSAPVIAP